MLRVKININFYVIDKLRFYIYALYLINVFKSIMAKKRSNIILLKRQH